MTINADCHKAISRCGHEKGSANIDPALTPSKYDNDYFLNFFLLNLASPTKSESKKSMVAGSNRLETHE